MGKIAILTSSFVVILGIIAQPTIAQNRRASNRVYLVRATLCNIDISNSQLKKNMSIHEFLLANKEITWRGSSNGRSISITSLAEYYRENCTRPRSSESRYEIWNFIPPYPLDENYEIHRRAGSRVYLSCSEKPEDNIDSVDGELIPIRAWMEECSH